MSSGFQAFDTRWGLPPLPPSNRPVFVLSAGWRSGSTLLQRLVCSSGDTLVWGEPYGRAGLIPAMTRSAICLREDWPAAHHYPTLSTSQLSSSWIANTFPPAQALRDAFRAQLDTLLAAPARDRGYPRWGIKEVRLQGMDAQLLKWLYPDARFALLVRDPWAAFSSAKGVQFALHWPTRMVTDAHSFAKHWAACARSFLELTDPCYRVIRYEELCAPTFDFEGLRAHLELATIDPQVRDQRIRGMAKPPLPLDAHEIAVIEQIAGPIAARFGYRWRAGISQAS